MRSIYLDYNATTPIAVEVYEAMLPFLSEYFGNPSSNHRHGRICREAVEMAREQLATLLGANHDDIFFTSGGTESNNLALKGVMLREPAAAGGHLVVSAIEHPSVLEPANWLVRQGYAVTVVKCRPDGRVDPDAIAAAMRPTTRLVSIMHANNETGVLQPISQIARFCRAHGALLHTDASQSVGKTRVQVDELRVDLLTVAGHKMYAPKGVGALYVRPGVPLETVTHGAGQERGVRPGTENVASIVALGRAAKLAIDNLDHSAERMAACRDRLQRKLREAIGPRLIIHGFGVERLPNTLSVSFPDVVGGELLAHAPEVSASTGAACHSDAVEHVSGTLAAMGLAAHEARGTIRLSVGRDTTEEEVDRAAELLIGAWESRV